MKKIGIYMSLLMAVTLSFFMSLIGTLTSGHFTVVSWLISFGISLVISLVIGLIVPMPKLEAAACRKAKLHPGTTKANLLSALISDTIYTPIMSVVMVLIMVGSANAGIDRGAAAINDEMTATLGQITSVQSELSALGDSDPAKSGELQAQLGELNGKYQSLTAQRDGMIASKPNMGMAILVSLLCCYPSGYIIIFIVQPLYLKTLLKKLGPPPGGPPIEDGAPPREER